MSSPNTISIEVAQAITSMRNADLRWKQSFIGLAPTISNPATFELIACPAPIDSSLQACLEDPQRFAVAHVILSQRHSSTMPVSADAWNGLHVIVDENGEGTYSAAQDHDALQEHWKPILAGKR